MVADAGSGGGLVDSSPQLPTVDGMVADPADAGTPQPADAALPTGHFAGGISMREVSVYQSVKVVLAQAGMPATRNAPVIDGAPARFGILFDVEPGFSAREIIARVTIDGTAYESTMTVGASSANTPEDGFLVEVPGDAFVTGARFVVSLHELADGPPVGAVNGARFPAAGDSDLEVQSSNGPLHLVIVPYRYDADGSGRMPPLDASILAQYEDGFRSMFPVAEIIMTVHEPVSRTASLSLFTWQAWLQDLQELRAAEAPASNVYYYGVMSPNDSFAEYCSFGCILGLGTLPDPTDSFQFTSVGVSFTDRLNVETAIHEVGHTMGRQHAPCGGAGGPDPGFPYPEGDTGVWGWSSATDEFKDPAISTDIMGYCENQWISDYQYGKIFDRISVVNGMAPAAGPPTRYRVGAVDAAGNVLWRYEVTLARTPGRSTTTVTLADGTTVQGHLYPFDHLPGGTLYVPMPDRPTRDRVLGALTATVVP